MEVWGEKATLTPDVCSFKFPTLVASKHVQFHANANMVMTANVNSSWKSKVYHNVAFKSSMTVVNAELKRSVVTINVRLISPVE